MGHQRTMEARAEAIWPTRSSSMKRQDSFSNIFFRSDCRNYRPISWVGKAKVKGAEGCFSFKALRVSPSWGAKPSAEASYLTAPLTSPSVNFAATLLFWISSPPRTPYLDLEVTCTTGRSVFSINWATCCLTNVERETCLPPPDSPGHLKRQ